MVRIVEVGPRDGLQNAPVRLAPAVRAEFARRAAAAGVDRVEAVSFVREDRIPQMAGAEEVVAALGDDVDAIGLVINPRGLERLISLGLPGARVLALTSDTFSRRNSNVGADEGLRRAAEMISRACEAGVAAGGIVGAAFGCPFEGEVPLATTVATAEALAAAGAREIILADTIGVAVPRQVGAALDALAGIGVPLGLHLHNTRNTGYANAIAGVQHGATVFDASLGGLGGCPFAPGAAGNIATEDLVYLLEREGVPTGVDLAAAVDAARWVAGQTGLELPGMVHRVDPFPPPLVQA